MGLKRVNSDHGVCSSPYYVSTALHSCRDSLFDNFNNVCSTRIICMDLVWVVSNNEVA